MRTLYDELKDAGIEMDSHESDLYVRATTEAREILKRRGVTGTMTFRSKLDGQLWIDVPFMYAPFWDRVQSRSTLEAEERAWAKGEGR